MSISAQLGIRGSNSFSANERPENFREGLLYEFPNGDFPITAIIATQASKEITDDFTFHWFDKELPTQAGAVTNVYIDAALATPYVNATHQATSGIAGSTVYAKVAEAVADEFRVGHLASLIDKSRLSIDVTGEVTAVVKNGASSYIAIKLREADPGDSSLSLATVDFVQVVSSTQAEGSTSPNAISYDPTHYESNTGIFEIPLSITRTAMRTRLRTVQQYQEAKREAREQMGVIMEKAIIRSILFSGTGSNGQPQHDPQGIFQFVETNNSANVIDFQTATTVNGVDFSGRTWEEAGTEFLLTVQEQFGRFGPEEVMTVGGSGALNAINNINHAETMFTSEPGSVTNFGLRTRNFIGQDQTWVLKKSPLMSQTEIDRNILIGFQPKNITTRFIDDVWFKQDNNFRKGGFNSVDALKESYMAELGWEFHLPKQWFILKGLGLDNVN